MRKARQGTTVVEADQVEQGSGAAERDPALDRLWGIAMLRIAMELKRPDAPGLDAIIDGVAERMGIEKAEFEKYLKHNLRLLKATARTKGYGR
ncbi:MAG: hypothetical protein ACK4N5_06280 [Myxococcales bacterium]